jgi:alkaline phosphatase
MSDQLAATSNGGATTHAFGYKVRGPGSFGKDGDRAVLARSGYAGSIMREAGNLGHPIGIVNDGDVAEPGTGAFLAEVDDRYNSTEIVRQMLDGRPGADDQDPVVVLGGGERFFLPEGTPQCETEVRLDCSVHVDQVDGGGPNRTDGRNLLQEAALDGWVIVRTRQQFDSLGTWLESDEGIAPKVLGLFAADDIFNDVPEEQLIRLGLVDDSRAPDDPRGRLIVWGSRSGTLGYDPPTAAEMTKVALVVLDRHRGERDKSFLLVVEVESTDNLPNENNAIGALRALRRADEVIEVVSDFQQTHPATLLLTTADSDASGLKLIAPVPKDASGMVTGLPGNSTGIAAERILHTVDGIEGRNTRPFVAAPDAMGQVLEFAIAWAGEEDVGGGVVARAQGANAELMRTTFVEGFHNTDVYRLMYFTLFGEMLATGVGSAAPDR